MTYLMIAVLIGAKGPSRWDALLRPYPETQVDPDEYRLGPGDSLRITISGSVSYTADMSLDVSGWVSLYGPGISLSAAQAGLESEISTGLQSRPLGTFLGKKYLSGMSISEATDSLNRFYKRYYKNINVGISLLYPRPVTVVITGQVLNQGAITCSAVERLTDVITKAGGALGEADLTAVRVETSDGTKTYNLYKYYLDGDRSQNPLLCNDMRIFVPQATKTVLVTGAVELLVIYFNDSVETDAVRSLEGARVVRVAWEDGDNVRRAIDKAGGLSLKASREGISILRGGIRMSASLETRVEPGDRIEVSKIPSEVYVFGEVRSPGAYRYSPGLTCMDYVSMAGPNERGYTKRFTIVRPDGSRVSVSPKDVPEPGDRILVERVAFLWYEDYLRVLATVTTIIVTWLTLRR
ncbi:MAG: SLBB domain-containing protein [candidate division WOR-3 bacterium]